MVIKMVKQILDFNDDGTVDLDDLEILKTSYGSITDD